MPGRVETVERLISKDDGGKLQARLLHPPGTLSEPNASDDDALKAVAQSSGGRVVLMVHQYSIMGGSQELMKGMARIWASKYKIPAATFNMRGVGKSTGSSTLCGHSEVDDVVAAAKWLTSLGFTRIFMMCSSAGAPIGGSALDRLEAFRGYMGIGYVFGFWASILFGGHQDAIFKSRKPRYFVMGDRDEFTSKNTLTDWAMKKAKESGGVAECRIYPGISHFEIEGPDFDTEMVDRAAEFIQQHAQEIWEA